MIPWTIRKRIETGLVFALLIFLIVAVPIAIGLACVMIPQLGDLIGLFFATWWIVGLVVIGPILLIGWLWEAWLSSPTEKQRHKNWRLGRDIPPPARPIPPPKIDDRPIHWKDPK